MAQADTYYASVGAPLIADVDFDANGSGVYGDIINGRTDIGTSTNRKGEYGPNVQGRLTNNMPPENIQGTLQRIGGSSSLTGYRYSNLIPPTGAIVASPVTYMFGNEYKDSDARNAGLNLTPKDIRTFDAYGNLTNTDPEIAARARRIVALNYKLLIHAGYESPNAGNGTITVHPNLEYVRQELEAGPVDFNNADSIRRILERSPNTKRTDAEGRRAAAQLIARFGQAADQYLTGADRVAAVEYGMRIMVLREVDWLFMSQRTAEETNHVLGITVEDLLAAFREFQTIPLPDTANAKYVPVVDYLPFAISRSPGTSAVTLTANDLEISLSAFTNGAAFTVVGVRVPSQFQSRLAVSLPGDGQIRIDQPGTQSGLIWFEYQVHDPSGAVSSSRVYFYQLPRG